jgi:hypothetical protein
VVGQLDQLLESKLFSGVRLTRGMKLALVGMMDLDFNRRLSPLQVMELLQRE